MSWQEFSINLPKNILNKINGKNNNFNIENEVLKIKEVAFTQADFECFIENLLKCDEFFIKQSIPQILNIIKFMSFKNVKITPKIRDQLLYSDLNYSIRAIIIVALYHSNLMTDLLEMLASYNNWKDIDAKLYDKIPKILKNKQRCLSILKWKISWFYVVSMQYIPELLSQYEKLSEQYEIFSDRDEPLPTNELWKKVYIFNEEINKKILLWYNDPSNKIKTHTRLHDLPDFKKNILDYLGKTSSSSSFKNTKSLRKSPRKSLNKKSSLRKSPRKSLKKSLNKKGKSPRKSLSKSPKKI